MKGLPAEHSQIIGTFGARVRGGVGRNARDKYRDAPENGTPKKVSEVQLRQFTSRRPQWVD